MAKKNKSTAREMETQEQKEARWAKEKKTAQSFARQCGIKITKAMIEANKSKPKEKPRHKKVKH